MPVADPHILLLHGADLFDRALWWEAHEVWEELWRAEPAESPARAALQGLIQGAAYQIKVREGRASAAERLRERALARLDQAMAAAGPRVLGVELGALRRGLEAHRDGDPPLQLGAIAPPEGGGSASLAGRGDC